METLVSQTPKQAAGKALTQLLTQYSGQPTLLLLSGGSALAILDYVDPVALDSHLTLSTLDERFSTDVRVNNFSQIQSTAFYAAAKERGAKEIKTTLTTTDTLAGATERFENALRAWRQNHPNGIVLATVGIGNDGHTAGIFPGAPDTDFSGADWVTGYQVPETMSQHTKRITVTHTFLRQVLGGAVVFAAGENKWPIVAVAQQAHSATKDLPVGILQELPQVILVTDDPAASLQR